MLSHRRGSAIRQNFKNIPLKEYGKISKNKYIEVRQKWQIRTTVIPIITGVLGMIKKKVTVKKH